MTTAANVATDLGLEPVRLQLAAGIDPARVVIRRMPKVVSLILPRWVAAMTLPRTVWLRQGRLITSRLIVHELVHAGQWSRGWLRFCQSYIFGYLRGLIRTKSFRGAYDTIPAEEEARAIAQSTVGSAG